MDPILAQRLDANSESFDATLSRNLAKLAKDYVTHGLQTLDYFVADFDLANDMVNCFGETTRARFDKLRRGEPSNFIHPMGATEIVTLATFVSQILFGGETTRKVEPRNPEDEPKADMVNELLAWNDSQQETYNQGYLWIFDALTFNRGVMYDRWQKLYDVKLDPIETELGTEDKPRKYTRWRKKRVETGGFTKLDLISPYDFICDPSMPISRFQEGRFAGHRVVLTWQELRRRSELPEEEYEYVLPAAVAKLQKGSNKKSLSNIPTTGTNLSKSRSFFERQRRSQPVTIGSPEGEKINAKEGAPVECWCIQIRTRPASHDIYPDDKEDELIEFLFAGDSELLSVNVINNTHDQFPYAVGEARPNAHMQFSPSWAMIIKPIQLLVDYYKDRRKQSLARTSGNIFLADVEAVDIEAFLDPDKDGLIIPLTESGKGRNLDTIFKQIPIQDQMAKMFEEMNMWIGHAETASGAHAFTQGETDDPSQTATQFVGVQQMATGRISSIARLLSVQGLVPQTRRIVKNLQQYLPPEITIRITGQPDDFDPDKPVPKYTKVRRDAADFTEPVPVVDGNGQPVIGPDGQPLMQPDPRADMPDIQGEFDVIPHDGSLPGTDARKVAALSRAVEAFSNNPALAPLIFDDTIPGSISIKRTFYKMLKATGFPIAGLAITKEEALKNLQSKMMATGMGNLIQPPQPSNVQPMPTPGPAGMPSAEQLPPTPSAAPPEIRPENAA